MKRFSSLTVLTILQGCAISHVDANRHVDHAEIQSARLEGDHIKPAPQAAPADSVSPISLCVDAGGCAKQTPRVVQGTEVGTDRDAPVIEGHPLTSVVVTQCNLVVAVYMTMPDGRFLRFDQKANVSAEELVTIAYSAAHSERVEVSCEGEGLVAYEKHEPI
ncbi:MAG TPA: hypothetical protein VKP66_02935 [Steroidobacteraceae bacterium]|nr:hypothetical protein [Steroidobacteraceae bacterium]